MIQPVRICTGRTVDIALGIGTISPSGSISRMADRSREWNG
jgi:hypothetical protein